MSLVVVLIISIIIIVVSLIVFVILNSYLYRSYSSGNSILNTVCQPGYCATSIVTGEKDCNNLAYDPRSQVCSLANSCSNQVLQYALNPDGSAEAGIECATQNCRCMINKQCSVYTQATFTLQDGYIQNPTLNNGLINSVSDSDLCSIPVDALFDIGCQRESWNTEDDMISNISSCMISNPCLRGQIAYLANPSTFTADDMTLYPVACVTGNSGLDSFGDPIEQGSVPIWDSGWGGIVQKSLN